MQTLINAKQTLSDISLSYPAPHTEILPLLQAQNSILACDIYARKSLPSFNNSAMDGYALRYEDASKTLAIQTSVFAGDSTEISLQPQSCVKIMTGARIPQGANCVVPFEQIAGGFNNTTHITAPHTLTPLANIKQEGEEVQKGSLLLKRGTQLTCDILTILATQGISQVRVFSPLKIAVFASGNELKEPWEFASATQIYNSNATMVQSILQSSHFTSQYCGILNDDFHAVHSALQTPSDVIFTTGGASKGEADFIRQNLQSNGATLLVDCVDIKPGKPVIIAHYAGKFIIALPGNPLASNIILRLLILPFLQQLRQANAHFLSPISLKCQTPLKRKMRTEAILATMQNAAFSFTKDGKYGSSEVTAIAKSNALVVLDANYTEIQEGDILKVIPFYAPFSATQAEYINTLET